MAELELLMTSIQKAELESYFLMNNCDFEFVTNSKLKVDDDMVDLVKRIISDRGISFLEKATVNDIKMIKKGDHFLVNENGEIHEYIASDDAIYSGRRWSVRVDAYTFGRMGVSRIVRVFKYYFQRKCAIHTTCKKFSRPIKNKV